ncbi:P-loop containing nucleoside triphosphate hydrolase protein [Absidia repens]|uniref:Peroxisomal ATPase PEX6 n=1 Tax=Absidia repens TaxID=90262 RepID=A0A1X2IVJ3_9FUNG|nr:P-loop containing nucleoside triphosphate hydrolase protein [Absidia repens]
MPPFITADLKIYTGPRDNQVVLVSPSLWNELQNDHVTPKSELKAISVNIPSLIASSPIATSRSDSGLKSFVGYAGLHSEDAGSERVVYASTHLIKAVYGADALSRLNEEEDDEELELTTLESVCNVQVKPVSLIELDELIIGALTSDSFERAQNDHDGLVKLVKGSDSSIILRSGGTYKLDGLSFQVLMTSPVQQGIVISDRTKIFVVDISSSSSASTGTSTPTSLAMNSSAVLTVPHSFTMLNGSSATSPTNPEVAEPQEFTAQILRQPWPEARLFPAPNVKEDDGNRVFVDVKNLAKCNAFSGDWVLASANDSKKSRLCRIYGIDSGDNEMTSGADDSSFIYLPPVLYYNLGLPLPPSIDSSSAAPQAMNDNRLAVCITRLTVPPPKEGPPLATSVSVARVSSPSLMDKSLQSAFLDSLKTWFECRERIVCNGDLIAITLDEDSVRLRPRNSSNGGGNDDEDENIVLHTNNPRKATTIGYFKVTNLLSGQQQQSSDDIIHPAFFGSGRRIVPSQTQLVQTGVEQSRVPIGCISHYYNLVDALPLYRSKTPARASLMELITSSLHPLGRDFELSCNALLQGPKGGGKSTLVREVVEDLGVHVFEFSVYDVVSDTDAKTELHLRAKFEKATSLAPCVVLIRGIEGLAKKSAVVETGQEPLLATVLQECIKNVNAAHASSGYPVMVIATTSDVEQLPSSILGCFRHEVVIEAPDEKARLQILKNLTYSCPLAPDVSMSSLATQTAALVAKDLVDLVARTGLLALQRINRATMQHGNEGNLRHMTPVTVDDIHAAGITLTAADFDAALSDARASYSDSIGAPKIPNVTWDDVGGLANVKDDILDTIQLPLEHPELFGSGLKKRSGILLYGPPGTGKTLLAKAIATSCSLNFFSVKGPELLNMYIGESEANVRRVFQRARDAKPCVIFFDELDSVAPKRGEKGDSGGVMDRIVSQLLAELDGMSEGGAEGGAGDVFVIGATNRPDLLDPALLRPGRFDKLLYLGVSQDHESQLRIIEALTRKFRLHPDLDLARVAEKCPFHYTGADFYALCTDAMLKAMTRVAETIEEKVKTLTKDRDVPMTAQYFLSHMATPEDIMVQVEEIDFVRALDELVPSVSATELAHYSKVREKFEQVQDDDDNDDEEGKQKNDEKELMEQAAQLLAEVKRKELEQEQNRQQQEVEEAASKAKKQPTSGKKSKGKGKARA